MRPSRDDTLMLMARVLARRSTCSRASVGVVIAREGRILSSGYNGAPAGIDHCDHSLDMTKQIMREMPGVSTGCTAAVHAEANAIAYAARYGMHLENAELFTTFSPCIPCAQLIIQSGITRVVWGTQYRVPEGLTLLRNAKIKTDYMEIDWSSFPAI